MITTQRAREIANAFGSRYKIEGLDAITEFSLLELQEAEVHFGEYGYNRGHRILIRQRIRELERIRDREQAGRIRAFGYVVRVLIGILLIVVGIAIERYLLS